MTNGTPSRRASPHNRDLRNTLPRVVMWACTRSSRPAAHSHPNRTSARGTPRSTQATADQCALDGDVLRAVRQVVVGLGRQARPLARLLGAKGGRKGLRLRQVGAHGLACALGLWVLQQRERQLLLPQQHRVRVLHLQHSTSWGVGCNFQPHAAQWVHTLSDCTGGATPLTVSTSKEQFDLGRSPHVSCKQLSSRAYLGAHLVAELLQLLLANDPRIAKPSPVRLDPCVWQLLGLELLRTLGHSTHEHHRLSQTAPPHSHHADEYERKPRLMEDLALLVPRRCLAVHFEAPHLQHASGSNVKQPSGGQAV